MAQVLHAYRGQHAGLSFTAICALAGRTEAQALAQLDAVQRYLRRRKSPWKVLRELRETEEGTMEHYFWLVAPHCPRPSARQVPELAEPEFISFDDIENEFPVLPRWDT